MKNNAPKRVKYKGQIYEAVAIDELEYSDNLVDQISYGAGHEITEREYLDVVHDRFYDELEFGHHNGRFESLEDLEDFVEWLNCWIVSGKERFR